VSNTDEATLKATAINWAKQFPERGVPNDLTEADARVIPRRIRNRAQESGMDGTQEIILDYDEYTVEFRGEWLVDLDEQGIPKGPPMHRR
jgi:hypothetical protein